MSAQAFNRERFPGLQETRLLTGNETAECKKPDKSILFNKVDNFSTNWGGTTVYYRPRDFFSGGFFLEEL